MDLSYSSTILNGAKGGQEAAVMMLLLLPGLLWLPPPSSSLLGDGACTAFMVEYNPALQIWLGWGFLECQSK